VRLFFKFENPTPVQTLAAIIDPTVIYPCFYLRNDRTDSCYCRNGKATPDPVPVFHKFSNPLPDPGPGPGVKNLGKTGSGVTFQFRQYHESVWSFLK